MFGVGWVDVGDRLALSIDDGVEGACWRVIDVYRLVRVNNMGTEIACSDVTAALATLIFPNEPSSDIRRHRYYLLIPQNCITDYLSRIFLQSLVRCVSAV